MRLVHLTLSFGFLFLLLFLLFPPIATPAYPAPQTGLTPTSFAYLPFLQRHHWLPGSPTGTPTLRASATPSAAATPAATGTPTPSSTPPAAASATPTPSGTLVPPASPAPSSTATATATPTAPFTATPTATPPPGVTPTSSPDTVTASPSRSPTPALADTASPTPASVTIVPQRGYWRGDGASFVVSADSRYLCSLTTRWPDPDAACGLAELAFQICLRVFPDGHFAYGGGAVDPDRKFEGQFTSPTSMDGRWTLSRGTCTASGAWTAAPTGGSFSCNQFGVVEMCAWVDDPAPRVGTPVWVYGQLLDDGIGQNGWPLHAVWHYPNATATCDDETGTEGRGLTVCEPHVYPSVPGIPVAIDVTITYDGRPFTATTSLTPRQAIPGLLSRP